MPLPRGVAVGADLQHADLLRDHRHREHGLGGGRSVAGFPPAGDIWFALGTGRACGRFDLNVHETTLAVHETHAQVEADDCG